MQLVPNPIQLNRVEFNIELSWVQYWVELNSILSWVEFNIDEINSKPSLWRAFSSWIKPHISGSSCKKKMYQPLKLNCAFVWTKSHSFTRGFIQDHLLPVAYLLFPSTALLFLFPLKASWFPLTAPDSDPSPPSSRKLLTFFWTFIQSSQECSCHVHTLFHSSSPSPEPVGQVAVENNLEAQQQRWRQRSRPALVHLVSGSKLV